jgi:transcriptional regulator with XRE-family HTH domain
VEGDLQRTAGRNIRAHRERLGESQEGYARSLHVHRTYLGGVERGERNLTLKSLERLAGLMGLEPLQLLTDADDLAPADVVPSDGPEGGSGPEDGALVPR